MSIEEEAKEYLISKEPYLGYLGNSDLEDWVIMLMADFLKSRKISDEDMQKLCSKGLVFNSVEQYQRLSSRIVGAKLAQSKILGE